MVRFSTAIKHLSEALKELNDCTGTTVETNVAGTIIGAITSPHFDDAITDESYEVQRSPQYNETLYHATEKMGNAVNIESRH